MRHCRESGLDKPTVGCECEACSPDARDECHGETFETLRDHCLTLGLTEDAAKLASYASARSAHLGLATPHL